MQETFDQFRLNVDRVHSLVALHNALRSQATSALEISDILRAALVMVVSALDQYVHDVVRLGMLDIWRRNRRETSAFLQFRISLNSARMAATSGAYDNWLEEEVRDQHGWQSFQQPDKIADAFRLVCSQPLWQEVANRLSINVQDVKEKLGLIIDRRNKIAHEADVDPTFPNSRWPIDERLVNDSVAFVERVVEAMLGILQSNQV